MSDALLEFEEVSAGYGDSIVLDALSFKVPEGSSTALLGRNGVGKSTLLLTIMGFTQLRAGTIRWRGNEVQSVKPHLRARMGLGWVPQERDVFRSLTVEQNLSVVARPGVWDAAKVYELFPRLMERRESRGDQLSGGEQQMLAIGRTLATNPAMLLLDEPLEGLAPIIVEELCDAIRRMVREASVTLILVEQHAELALEMTDQAIVLERGRIVQSVASKDLIEDKETLERHIGLNLQ